MNLPKQLYTLYGKTGVGKTAVMESLRSIGCQVMHLEELAGHRGSVFGKSGMLQPKSSEFMEQLKIVLEHFDHNKTVFIEWKGSHLGQIKMPTFLVEEMRKSKGIYLVRSLEERIALLAKNYHSINQKTLYDGLFLLRPRLNELQFSKALAAVDDHNLPEFMRHIIPYFDQSRNYVVNNQQMMIEINCTGKSNHEIATEILDIME